MLVIEILTALCAGFLIAGVPAVLARHRVLQAMLLVTLAGTGAVLALEPFRWQLVPLFVLVVLGCLFGARRWRRGYRRRAVAMRAVAVATALLLLIVAAAPLAVFPLFDLPPPAGPAPVGVIDMRLADHRRTDPLFGGTREIMVRAWYPARATKNASHAPYMSRRLANALLWGPDHNVVFNHLPLVRTAGLAQAPVLGGSLPVVIFVPGYQSFNTQSTALAQDLASNGYVVLSLGMPGDAAGVDFPDGRVKLFRRYGFLDELGRGAAMLKALGAAPSANAMAQLADKFIKATPTARDAQALEMADVRMVLDRVERGGLTALDGHLDPQRVAIVGMSFGGSVAGSACAVDSRCRAAINLDGFMFGNLRGRPLIRPLLIVANGSFGTTFFNDTVGRTSIEVPGAPQPINLRVRGSRHLDFTDLTLAFPVLKRLVPNEVVGPIDGRRMIALTSAIVRGFLDEQLLGRRKGLQKAISAWPEIALRNPPLPDQWKR